MLCSVVSDVYLRVQRRRLEAELMNIGEERSIQLLTGCWDIQAALPLLFCHNFCIAWRSCGGRASCVSEFLGIIFKIEMFNLTHDREIRPTFRPLRQTHAQPAHAALAADAGGAGAERVERDGSDDQWQVQGQINCPGYVHIYLSKDTRLEHASHSEV